MTCKHRLVTVLAATFVLVVTCVIFTSCPHPIDLEVILQTNDRVSPIVEITCPEDGSSYAQYVVLSGKATDCCDDDGHPGCVASLSYVIVSSGEGATIAVAEDGSFSTSFSTAAYNDDIVIRIAAEDWHGNCTELSIRLTNAGNDIPSFCTSPGNGMVELRWDEVPLAESYVLYDTTWGTEWESVSSPHVCSGLTNGELHSYRLKAICEDGTENWSDYVETFALSPRTLTPAAAPLYDGIELEWLDIPGCSEYAVLRSESPEGPYSVRTYIQDNAFTDLLVTPYTDYYYKIRPSSTNLMESEFICARNTVFSDPRIAGSAISGGCEVEVHEGFAYTTGGEGLSVVDISNPAEPVVVGLCRWESIDHPVWNAVLGAHNLPQWLMDIEIAEFNGTPYLFGVTAYFGFLIFNVADPANITLEYESRLEHPADLSVSGDRVLICQHGAYFGEHPGEVLEFEVDPTDVSQTVLTQEMNYDPDCYPWGIVTDVEFAYVSCGYKYHTSPTIGDFSMKVLTIDDLHTNASVSLDPWHPNRITLVERPAGRRVYVGCFLDDLVAVINVDTPLAPAVSTTIATSDSANGMDVAGDRLYVSDGVQGLTVVDNTDLDNPFVERLIPCNSGVANDVRVTDGYAVVSDLAGAVHVVDLMELTDQPQTWTHDLGNQGERLDVEGHITAVVTHSPSCITFYDVSDPAAPEQLSSISPPPDEEYRDVKLSGSSAYAWFNHSIWSSEMQALDLSDLREPRVADSHYYYSYSSRDLEVWGPYVYLSQFEGGLRFLDVSDPYNVIALPSIVTSAYDVEVSDSLLLVAPVGSPLRIFDNSNKLAPQLISTCAGAANAYRVVADFDSAHAFVIAAERAGIEEVDRTGLYAVDISDPAAPAAGPFLARPDLDNPVLSGNRLFVTHSESEIIVYDTSDPDNLPEVATISCAGVQDICVRGRFLYAIASNGVLSIMELKGITID